MTEAMPTRSNAKRMQAAVQEIAHGIIHKAMPGDLGLPGEHGGGDAHPEMGAGTGAVLARMTEVGGTFVQHFELARREAFRQPGAQRFGGDAGAHHSPAPASLPSFM